MIKQEFKIKERKLLKEIINKNIISINYTEPTYGNIKIDFDDYSIIISNVMHQANLIGDDEEITYFTLNKIDKTEKFDFFLDDAQIHHIEVNEKIESICIVNDIINYNDKYEVSYDMAIILKTNRHEYIVSRDWFYMETMAINIDKSIDDIIQKNQIIENYRGEDSSVKVTIARTIDQI
jgi:hypothetical protein